MSAMNPLTARMKALLGIPAPGPNGQDVPIPRSRCRRLAPWEELAYFDNVAFGFHQQVSSGAWEVLIGADPQRVSLWISASSTYHIAPLVPTQANQGIWAPTTTGQIVFREKDDGPLASLAWWVNTAAAQVVTTMAVRLLRFPECDE